MGWHRSGAIQEPNMPARSKQAQSPSWSSDACAQVRAHRGVLTGCALRGMCSGVLTGVCAKVWLTGVCSRGVHSGVCAQVCSQVCVLRYGSQGCAHGVCTQGYVLRCAHRCVC